MAISSFTGLGGSSFSSLTPAPATAAEAEPWVRGELIRRFMGTNRSASLVALVLIPIVVCLSWGYVPHWHSLLWLAGALGVAGARIWALRKYSLHFASGDNATQEKFAQRHRHLWTVTALVWGSSVLLFFERAPLTAQFVSWLIIAGTATFPLYAMAMYLPVLRVYVNTLFATVLVCIAIRTFDQGLLLPAFDLWFFMFPAAHWFLLLYAGRNLHQSARNSLELLFHNHILINSLTRQRQAAVAAVAMKNRFLTSAAHDMRQPVLALSLYADWLRNEPELVNEIAPKIVRATHAVNALFDSLFDLARIDSGEVRMQIESVDMAQLFHDLEVQYRPLAEAKGLSFAASLVEGSVTTDPVRIRRMIGNLLANAIKYTDEGGVRLTSRRGSTSTRIEVWDTGVGIAREHLRDIFLEFYKVADHAGTSDGFGLGLAIVTRLSHSLGHPVRVRSRPGRGSVFKVTLHDVDQTQSQARVRPSVD